MNAPLSFRERHALQLHAGMRQASAIDPTGHLARLNVKKSPREVAAPYLQQLKAQRFAAQVETGGGARKSFAALCCWHDTPELYRRMVAHAAGLPREVADKIDRDLTEREKELIRSAVRDMRGYFESLVRL